MNDAQIKHMVDRFLSWKLPDNFSPDAGISFGPPVTWPWPTGTNLFDATQADAMVRHMVEGLPAVNSHATLTAERDADLSELEKLRAEVSRKDRCLMFFQSVIRSGEPWTETCEREYAAATSSLLSPPKDPAHD